MGLGLGEFVDLGFKNCRRKGYVVVLGIKRWFDELIDGYLVEESMWDFWVLIGKRKGLGLQGRRRREFFGVRGLY